MKADHGAASDTSRLPPRFNSAHLRALSAPEQ
jgi:hypothetical protein